MMAKHIIFLVALAIIFVGCSSKGKQQLPEDSKGHMLFERDVKEYLGHPFGTVVELEAELVDGTTRQLKGDDGVLFLRVTSVAGVSLKAAIEMRFEDETDKVTPDAFGLYGSSVATDEIKGADTTSEIKKGFIGGKVKLVAYETGLFSGIPEKYTDYQPVKADKQFHFEHSLVVIGCLNCDSTVTKK